MNWQLRDRQISFDESPVVMGILNVTPDSFSDGGQYLDPLQAVDRALEMIAEGADIIDVGGESTRPSAPEVTIEIEQQRVVPVIKALANQTKTPISIDTQKPEVAAAALDVGALIVNDVNAAAHDSHMLEIVRQSQCGYVCMHMQGNPRTMQQAPTYEDVVVEVDAFFDRSLEVFQSSQISLNQIVLDVGIGFGKTVAHNLELLHHLARYKKHGRPILLGVSRKSFLGKVLGDKDVSERRAGSLACVCWGMRNGVTLFRVHDVSETVQVLQMWGALDKAGK